MYKKRESCKITYLLACLFFLAQYHGACADDLSFLSDQMLAAIDLSDITRSFGVNMITKPGFYFISRTVPSSLLIRSSDVVLELAGNTIQGGVTISSNLQNVTIQNGIVDCNSTALDGIVANSGCNNIVVQNMQIKNGARGIFLNGVTNGLVANCELTLNSTGATLVNSHNIIVDNTVALNNQVAGFDLLNSTTCLFQNCKALSTGKGNNTTSNNFVCGFVSNNGYGNIFERCIANGTQALSTIDSNSIVAGFALQGSEGGSKIINCESANATTSSSGFTVPYGILLQAQVAGLTVVTTADPGGGSGVHPDSIHHLAWSPDGKYLGIAGQTYGGAQPSFFIYRFDYAKQALTQVAATTPTGTAGDFSIGFAWSPDGNYLAIGSYIYPHVENDFFIYNFNRTTEKLTLLQAFSLLDDAVSSDEDLAVSWAPNGNYIVASGKLLNSDMALFRFDSVTQITTKIQVITFNGGTANAQACAWSPDSNYVAMGGFFHYYLPGSDALYLFYFNSSSQQLVQVDAEDVTNTGGIRSIAWSPDGRYLAVVGVNIYTGPTRDIVIFQLNNITQKLQLVASVTISGDIQSVVWSPDGTYIATGGGNGINTMMYLFDRLNNSLNLVASTNPDPAHIDIYYLAWSPDGQYLVGSGFSYSGVNVPVYVWQALTFPSNNVITNNTVYCNSGGSIPSGIGISGSSIANMIIQNTAYSNPIAPFSVDTSYAFVQNVFNQQFGIGPTGVQNIAVGYRQVIAMPDSLSLLLKQDIFLAQSANAQLATLIAQQTSASFSAACAATPITSGPITTGGFYCLANDITSGGLAINASNVTLDLNGRRVAGGITFSNQNFVKVMNGVVLGTATTNGITASSSSNVTLDHVTIKNAFSGVNFTNVIDSTISACSFVQNGTGVFLTSCANIFIDDSSALNSTNIGFDLISSTTCTITNSKALSTGQGNIQTSNATIGGFVTNSGYGNVFENCIANGTQGLNVTDSSSLVAGFVFAGSENCSKIISCEASNAITNSSGFTVPYGIVLQGSTSSGLTLVNNSPSPTPAALMNAVAWSPDGQYLATGGSEGIIRIYQYNRVTAVLSSLTNVSVQDSGTILTMDWRKDGKFLAVSVNASAASVSSYINIYSFCTINNVLTLVATQNNQNASDASVFTAWHPSGTLLASVEGTTINKAYVYQFNPVTYAISLLGAGTTISAQPFEISWSPDGNYLAIAESQLYEVYSFNPAVTNPFSLNTSVAQGGTPFFDARIAWSPDGKYIAIGKYDSTNSNLIIYSFSPGSLTIQGTVGLGSAGGAGTYIPVAWSNDSNYVVAGHRILVEICQLNRSAPSVLPVAILVATTNVSRLSWSIDGGLIALADNGASPFVFLYSGITFPSDNVIQNNVIYCNSGGSIPSGIGISGSSITNMIIQNTAYTNPIPQTTGTNPGPMVFTNYAFVTNVFTDQLQNMPTLLQNISLSTTAVNSPLNTALLIQQALSRITSTGLCGPTALTVENITPGLSPGSFGTLNIGVGGNYCLAQDLTVDALTINASSVTLDLNGNALNGTIQVNTFSNVLIKNGTVFYAGVQNTNPVVSMTGTTNGILQNVDVINPDATGSGNSVIGVQLSGTSNCQVIGCTISSGNARGTNASPSAVVLTNGAAYSLIKNCIVKSGDAGTGGNGAFAGHGMQIDNGVGSAVNNVEVVGCTIMRTGNGGFESGAAAGGNGGNGIITGQNALKVSIHDCTIRNTGNGGAGTPFGLPGKAIYDQANTSGSLSVIFKNWGLYIANPTKFDLQAPSLGTGGPEDGIFSPNPPTSTVLNTWANIFSKP